MADPGRLRYKPFNTLLEAQADTTVQDRQILFINNVMYRKVDGAIFPVGTLVGVLATFPSLGDVATLYIDSVSKTFYLWNATSSNYDAIDQISSEPTNQWMNPQFELNMPGGLSSFDMAQTPSTYKTRFNGVSLNPATTYGGIINFTASNPRAVNISGTTAASLAEVVIDFDSDQSRLGGDQVGYPDDNLKSFYYTQQLTVNTNENCSVELVDSAIDILLASGEATLVSETGVVNVPALGTTVLKSVYKIDLVESFSPRKLTNPSVKFYVTNGGNFSFSITKYGQYMGDFSNENIFVTSDLPLADLVAERETGKYYEEGSVERIVPFWVTGLGAVVSDIEVLFKSIKESLPANAEDGITISNLVLSAKEFTGGGDVALTVDTSTTAVSEDGFINRVSSTSTTGYNDWSSLTISFDWEYRSFED